MRLSLPKATKVLAFIILAYLSFLTVLNLKSRTNESENDLKSSKVVKHGGHQEFVALSKDRSLDSLIYRQQRSAKSIPDTVARFSDDGGNGSDSGSMDQIETGNDDIFIAVKTTKENHKTRMKLLLDTWISIVKYQTYIFTDDEDSALSEEMPHGHVINTGCPKSHYRTALCCKMAREYDHFMESGKRWFCHVDDDTYLNFPQLVQTLRKYDHEKKFYLGKPSLRYPIETIERPTNQKVVFWFATGGAGFCLSKGLALEMMPHAGGGRFVKSGDAIRLPDDCTIGYIVNYLLKVDLTRVNNFHSHLEALWRVNDPENQLTFSYNGDNSISIKGFSAEEDPTRFKSAHCRIYPNLKSCPGVINR